MSQYNEDFLKFARDFFLYTTYFPLYPDERATFNPKIFILQTKTAVCEMSSCFSSYMRMHVFERSRNVTLKTDKDLLRFLGPRCLRILTDNHWSFITVMSLIHEFLLYLQMNRLCFRFHFTAYKCLDLVFRRCYSTHLEQMGGWESFQEHVRKNLIKIRPFVSEREIIDQEIVLKQAFQSSMVELLKQLENVNYEGFVLHSSEIYGNIVEDPRRLEIDPEEVDDDPFVVDLTPPPDLVEQKARGFDDYELGIPISSLLPVPPYEKPLVYTSSDESESSSGNDSPPSEGDLSPPNSDLENLLSDNSSVAGSVRSETDNDNFDDEYEKNFETRTGFTPFEIYTSVMMKEAAQRYGAEKFRDKLLKRKCESCGILCYKYSYRLFKTQLDWAIRGRYKL